MMVVILMIGISNVIFLYHKIKNSLLGKSNTSSQCTKCNKALNASGYLLQLHSDMDRGDGSIKYILSGEGAGVVFTIDDTTGDIHAIQRLDREERSQYTLRAQALDRRTSRPMEPESEFIIKIQDINDNEPKFLDGPYVASVPEMSPVGKGDFNSIFLFIYAKLINKCSKEILGLCSCFLTRAMQKNKWKLYWQFIL